MRHPELKLLATIISGCSLLASEPALADSVSSVSSWSSTTTTRFATPLTSGSVNTSFTAYSGTAVPYAMGTFYVGSTGSFSASLNAGNVSQGLQIIRGTFTADAAAPPSTLLTDVLYGTQGSGGATISGANLQAGQQYTYLLLFQNFTSGTDALLTLSGNGCISLGSSNSCIGNLYNHPFTQVASDSNRALASMLDQMISGTPALNDTLTALAGLDSVQQDAALSAILTKISPTSSRALQVASRDSMTSLFDLSSARLDILSRQIASPREAFWFSWHGKHLTQDAQGEQAGYTGSSQGSVVGIDYALSDQLDGGLALAYTDTRIDYRDLLSGNRSDVNSVLLGAYFRQRFNGWQLDGMGSYANQHYRTRRDIAIGAATGEFTGAQWGARLAASMPLLLTSATTLTPEIRLDWNRIVQNGYQEQSDTPLALRIAASSSERLQGSLGFRYTHTRPATRNFSMQPHISLFWQHEFRTAGAATQASFADGGNSFTTPGQALARHTLALSSGVDIRLGSTMAASIDYHLGRANGYTSHTARASLHWAF